MNMRIRNDKVLVKKGRNITTPVGGLRIYRTKYRVSGQIFYRKNGDIEVLISADVFPEFDVADFVKCDFKAIEDDIAELKETINNL